MVYYESSHVILESVMENPPEWMTIDAIAGKTSHGHRPEPPWMMDQNLGPHWAIGPTSHWPLVFQKRH